MIFFVQQCFNLICLTKELKDHRLTWTPSFRVLNLARFMNDFLSTASHMPTHNTAEPTTYVRLIKVRINEYTLSLESMPI